MIRDKAMFYNLAKQGLIGNTPMCWMSIEDYRADSIKYPTVTFRSCSLGKFKGANPWMKGQEIEDFAADHKNGSYVIMEAPNEGLDNCYGLQGELGWYRGWILYYTHRLGYMRQKLADDGRHAFGLNAINLIKGHASPAGADMLFELFEKFIDGSDFPVIEFAVLPKSVGYYSMDTLVWEIRNGY